MTADANVNRRAGTALDLFNFIGDVGDDVSLLTSDAETSDFARSEPMRYGEAFAAQGVPNIGRRQWSALALDRVDVVTIWRDRISVLPGLGVAATADLNASAVSRYSVGQQVRGVIVAPYDVDRLDGAKVRVAWPDNGREWEIAEIEGRVLKLVAREAEDSLRAQVYRLRQTAAELVRMADVIAAEIERAA